jgi:hypothetical protein
VQYESSDAAPRLIGWLAVGIAAFLVASPLILFAIYAGEHFSGGVTGDMPMPSHPRLQIDPGRDLAKLHAEDEALLSSYGWTDRKAGVARIPIARAMELTAEHGIPHWEEQTPAPLIPPRVPQ